MPSFSLNQARTAVQHLLSEKLGRNIGWLTLAELVSRVGRIIAAIVLAHQLDAAAFGVAAIAITIFEIVRAFAENGIGAAVIRARRREFAAVANTAHKLMWRICLLLAGAQLALGLLVEHIMPGRQAGAMVAVLGLVFLVMPFGVLHAYCLQRAERMKKLAVVASSQAVADHVLTAVLALSGWGAWAIVLPKVLTAPLWLFGVRHSRPWKRNRMAGYAPVRAILSFSLPVLGAELLSAFRDQLDKLLVSLMLGVEALGLYYFAFNAGLGISTALNRAFANAIYPHLCAARDRLKAYRRAVLTLVLPLGLAYCVQAAAAIVYVPVVFGPNWAEAAPLVALLCLGGPARLLVDGARMQARADGRSGQDFLIALGLSASVLVPFAAAAPQGLISAAMASVAGATLYALAITVRVTRATEAPTALSQGAAP